MLDNYTQNAFKTKLNIADIHILCQFKQWFIYTLWQLLASSNWQIYYIWRIKPLYFLFIILGLSNYALHSMTHIVSQNYETHNNLQEAVNVNIIWCLNPTFNFPLKNYPCHYNPYKTLHFTWTTHPVVKTNILSTFC